TKGMDCLRQRTSRWLERLTILSKSRCNQLDYRSPMHRNTTREGNVPSRIYFTSTIAGIIFLALYLQAEDPTPAFRIQLDTISPGYDGTTCWVHPRAGTILGERPIVVLTMQKLLLTGSDVFFALNEMRTDDLGKTWSGPKEHTDTLGRRMEAGGVIVATC